MARINLLPWREAALFRGLGDLGAMLVRAREEEDVVALLAMVARHCGVKNK